LEYLEEVVTVTTFPVLEEVVTVTTFPVLEEVVTVTTFPVFTEKRISRNCHYFPILGIEIATLAFDCLVRPKKVGISSCLHGRGLPRMQAKGLASASTVSKSSVLQYDTNPGFIP
jgi:hypothetical protein